MGFGLRALNRMAGSSVLDRVGARKPVERALYTMIKNGFRSAAATSRTFKAAQKLRVRSPSATRPRTLFDITPDDEQQMLKEAVRDFAAEEAARRRRTPIRRARRRLSCSPKPTGWASTCSACPRSWAA